MADLNYTVPGLKFVYAQPSTMACWATVYTMMKSWKRGTGYPNIRGAIVPLGTPWITYFDSNTGIPPAQGSGFQAAVGLVQEPRSNPSPQGWQALLQQYGLLWVTGTVPGGIHDRILQGISGDETGPGTFMSIIDPSGGRQYLESLDTFLAGFEGQSKVEPFYSDYQILHFASAQIVQERYTVRSGDTLSSIAKLYYDDADKWPLIFNANKRIIGPNPNIIRTGQQLVIPPGS